MSPFRHVFWKSYREAGHLAEQAQKLLDHQNYIYHNCSQNIVHHHFLQLDYYILVRHCLLFHFYLYLDFVTYFLNMNHQNHLMM